MGPFDALHSSKVSSTHQPPGEHFSLEIELALRPAAVLRSEQAPRQTRARPTRDQFNMCLFKTWSLPRIVTFYAKKVLTVSVAFLFQVFFRNESRGGKIHAIPEVPVAAAVGGTRLPDMGIGALVLRPADRE